MSRIELNLDRAELDTCVSCGLCLPDCPTYRVTGVDAASPRGRITLMRAVNDGGAPITEEFVEAMTSCVQCRGCETACPSGVPFGHLMEDTRTALAAGTAITPRWQRAAMAVLGHHRLLLAGSSLLAVAQRFRLVPSRRLGLPARLPIRRPTLQSSGDDVYLFTGCVMDAWQRDVHVATKKVIEATGAGVTPTGAGAACCGALHTHAGLTPTARKYALATIEAMPLDRPILVNSAGCGAALKDYGRLLDTPAAHEFAERVVDVSEWLAPRIDLLDLDATGLRVAIQDPCHLRHVQKAHLPVRTVLAALSADVVELDDEGLCCGAGGAYSVLEPELAGSIRARKLESIERAAPDIVASANPGCSIHLANAGVRVAHPMQIVAEALR